ncbi:hypothetical protein E2C01_097784 [Portunus trituberculatus]|uniref:Uncharacterized protein n=1 Tax=Portunus trituberculatus TaxID=210409 RepID=A0A5B7K6J8_PORTR|nr:hypothetical protein [Portunus trituberculatus]
MSALQMAAEGRDYLMWCPDQEFDNAVSALDIRVSVIWCTGTLYAVHPCYATKKVGRLSKQKGTKLF